MTSALGLVAMAAGVLLIWAAISGRSAVREVLAAIGR